MGCGNRSLVATTVVLVVTGAVLLAVPGASALRSYPSVPVLTIHDFSKHVNPEVDLAVILFTNNQDYLVKHQGEETLLRLNEAAFRVRHLDPKPFIGTADGVKPDGENMNFPEIRAYRYGKKIENVPWRGSGGTAESLEALIRVLARDASHEAETIEAARAFVPTPQGGANGTVVFGFFPDDDEAMMEKWLEMGDQMRHTSWLRFVHSHSQEVAAEYGHNSTFVVFNDDNAKRGGPNPAVYHAGLKFSADDIQVFLAQHGPPLVGVLTDELKELLDRNGRPTFRMYIEDTRAVAEWVTRLEPLAVQFPKMDFVVASDKFWSDAIQELNFQHEDVKVFAAAGIWLGEKKYRVEFGTAEEKALALSTRKTDIHGKTDPGLPFTVESAAAFIKEYEAGNVQRHFRTTRDQDRAHLPEGRPLETNGRQFRRDVLEAKEPLVVVVYYMSWSGHCFQFLPIYDKIAERLKHRRDIKLLKIDGGGNEVPPAYRTTDYPTIFISTRKNRHRPEIYRGDRLLEDLVRHFELKAKMARFEAIADKKAGPKTVE